MAEIKIKKIGIESLADLQDISRKTFTETFADSNTEEDMIKYLAENLSSEKLSIELNNIASLFYSATIDTKVIGYLKLNLGNAQTELNDKKALEIERIYVLKEYHGEKVGQLLYEKAIQVANDANVDYIWLGVWEKNPRAISFYQKNGFVEFDRHIFRLGNDEQTDIMMKRML